MRLKLSQNLILACILCVLLVSPSFAAIQIQAPESARQGSAVLVHFTSDDQLEFITAKWLGKTFPVPMNATASGYRGMAVIAMPLEGTDTLPLIARSATASAQTHITTAHVDWPRQEIRVETKYVDPPAEVQEQIRKDQQESRAILKTISPMQYWQLPFVRPVTGDVTSRFGGLRVFNGEPRSRHRGTDLRGPTGTPIHAMASGIVALAGEQYFSGNIVYIDHGQGLVSLYAHMSELTVTKGQLVKAGQQIGKTGATGRVTGPHLHWGVFIHDKPVDPLSLLTLPGAS